MTMAEPDIKEAANKRLWDAISFDERVEIDMAIGQNSKVEAIKRCMCAGKKLDKDFALATAERLVNRRAKELSKRTING